MAELVALISSVITIVRAVNEGLKSVEAVRCASEDFGSLQVTFPKSHRSTRLIRVLRKLESSWACLAGTSFTIRSPGGHSQEK